MSYRVMSCEVWERPLMWERDLCGRETCVGGRPVWEEDLCGRDFPVPNMSRFGNLSHRKDINE